jgi:hypothetical protein
VLDSHIQQPSSAVQNVSSLSNSFSSSPRLSSQVQDCKFPKLLPTITDDYIPPITRPSQQSANLPEVWQPQPQCMSTMFFTTVVHCTTACETMRSHFPIHHCKTLLKWCSVRWYHRVLTAIYSHATTHASTNDTVIEQTADRCTALCTNRPRKSRNSTISSTETPALQLFCRVIFSCSLVLYPVLYLARGLEIESFSCVLDMANAATSPT